MKNRFMVLLIFLFVNQFYLAQDWEKIETTFYPEGHNTAIGYFASSTQGWCASNVDGRIWHTSDGGHNWYSQKDSSGSPVYSIYFIDTLKGWAFGDGIFRTTDGGKNWENVGFEGLVYESFFFDSLKGLIASGQNIFKTVDGGLSWTATDLHIPDSVSVGGITYNKSISMTDITFLNDSVGFACGGLQLWEYGTTLIFKCIDGGDHWEQIANIDDRAYYSIIFMDDKNGYITGERLLYTIDGGKNWSYSNGHSSQAIVKTSYLGDGKVWGVSAFEIFSSEDCGKSWTKYGFTNQQIYSINFTNNYEVGYIFGYNKALYRYDNATSMKNENELAPAHFELYQNYPNPFNPTTEISYTLPQNGFVQIKIYDILGNQVETLVEEFQSFGEHKTTFKAENLASGIYFYRLKAGKYSRTKKMILLR